MDAEDLTLEDALTLQTSPLFRNQPKRCMDGCIAHRGCTLEGFSKGAEVYTPTRYRSSLGILLEGSLRVSKGPLSVSVLKKGELFGAAALFNGARPYEATLTARSRCRILFLTQEAVTWTMGRFPTFAGGYILYLSERIHFLSRKLETLTAAGAGEKLGRYLEGKREMQCSATELAKRLDVSRASLYRAFSALEERGAIARNGKHITVLDEGKLYA